MKSTLNEDDLVKIFAKKKKRNADVGDIFFGILYKIMLFALIFGAVYGIINFGAFREKLNFWYKNDVKAEPYAENNQPATPVQIAEDKPSKQEPVKPALPEMQENTILIPSLNITAPITWRVENISKDVTAGLQKGVIHLSGTALPGERGNIYITGHSSNYIWAKGDYNNVFALLNNLVAGDMAYIKFDDQVYTYKIKDQKVTLATDMSILSQTNDSKLTLVTCWPVGTSLKRLVVTGIQTYPDPKENKNSNQNANFNKLPGAR